MRSSITGRMALGSLILSIGSFPLHTNHAATLKHAELYQDESSWLGFGGGAFRLCRISSNGAIPEYVTLKTRVTFDEDSDQIDGAQLKQLKEYTSQIKTLATHLHITAHADQCGDPQYNQELARRRGRRVWDVLKSRLKPGLPITAKVLGEQESSDHSRHDRYVEIQTEVPNPNHDFEHLVVFDISGSLHPANPYTHGRTVSGATFEKLKKIELAPGTLAFVARDPNYRCQGPVLAEYLPIGDDYYHDAMILLTDALKGSITSATTWSDDTDPQRSLGRSILAPFASKKKLNWEVR